MALLAILELKGLKNRCAYSLTERMTKTKYAGYDNPISITTANLKEEEIKEEVEVNEEDHIFVPSSRSHQGGIEIEGECSSERVQVPSGKNCGRPRKYATLKEYRIVSAARKRMKRASWTPEERQEMLQKERVKKKQRKMKRLKEDKPEKIIGSKSKCIKTMTPDELREKKRIYRYFEFQAKLARMTVEEKEEYYKKMREYNREHRLKMTKEQKDKEQQRQYFNTQARLAEMTEEEREERKRRNTEYARKWREKLTGEKRERYKEYIRNWQKKNQVSSYAPKSSEQYQRLLEYQRNRTATETPEERQRRLRRLKINQAVRKLRKNLENEGVPPEEIEAKAMELKAKLWAEPLPPPEKLSSFTPRSKVGDDGKETMLPQESNKRKGRRRLDKNASVLSVATCSYDVVKLADSQMTSGKDLEPEVNVQDVTSESDVCFDSVDDDGFDDYQNENFEDENSSPLVQTLPEKESESPSNSLTAEEDFTPISPSNSTKEVETTLNCPHCISSFLQKCDLTDHIISVHPKKCWKCPLCKLNFPSPSEFKEHFESQHVPKLPEKNKTNAIPPSDKKFSCLKCDNSIPEWGKVFKSLKGLKEHVKAKHKASYWPCSKCDLLKYSERSLRVHEKVCSSGGHGHTNKKEKVKS